MVVDRRRAGTLDDEHVLISHRAVDLHRRLEREELGDVAWREGDAEAEGAAWWVASYERRLAGRVEVEKIAMEEEKKWVRGGRVRRIGEGVI